jgi:hypothetical protein
MGGTGTGGEPTNGEDRQGSREGRVDLDMGRESSGDSCGKRIKRYHPQVDLSADFSSA